MRRIPQLDFVCRDISPANNKDQVDDMEEDQRNIPQASITTHRLQPSIPPNPMINRLFLLPAYPTFDRYGAINRDHLLLANISRRVLTTEQRRRRDHHSFHQPFTLIDQSNDVTVRPFFVSIYHRMYEDLTQRLHVDNAILDYNYERLRQCINIMIQERIRHGFDPQSIMDREQLRIDEYALALEFYVQIDVDLFFMKTCSFRNVQPSLYNHHGIFCIDPPHALYGMTPCRTVSCRFCFPITDIITQARQDKPVVQFSSAQQHRFVNGYEAILNGPVSCTTSNILYALTCPCGQFEYVSHTSESLGECLINHREQGNRIIHEFILGTENIARLRQQPKSLNDLVADEMLLYQHSAHCPSAIQMFLDCNPNYWCFIPMLKAEVQAQAQNLASNLQSSREQDTNFYMNHLPRLPSEKYTFSTHQRLKQSQIFKTNRDSLAPNVNVDLFNATIIAVLPDNCSDHFYRIIEALFITQAQTKLNTLGHLVDMVVENSTIPNDWCQNLVRRPKMLNETRTFMSHRMHPHYQ